MDIIRILAEISVYSGIIFIAVMLLKKGLYKKMSPALHYGIWLLLIVRLMMPFTIESGFDLFVVPQAQAEVSQSVPDIGAGPVLAVNIAGETATDTPDTASPSVQRPGAAAIQPPVSYPLVAPHINAWDILVAIWTAGILISLVYMAVSYMLLRKRILGDALPVTGRLLALFESCKRELGIRRGIKVMRLPGLATPALCVPSTVLLPADSLEEMDDAQVRFAYRHELMHLKRGDHIMGIVLKILQAVYWFNPVVWIALKQIHTDMESACDSAVVRHMNGDDKTRYAGMILSLFARKSRGLVLGMAQGDTKKAAEQRIRGIFMDGRSGKGAWIISAMVALTLLIGCFTTACQPAVQTAGWYDGLVRQAMDADQRDMELDKLVIEDQINKRGACMEMVIEANPLVTIDVDAEIVQPGLTPIPLVRIRPRNISKKQFEAFMRYIAPGQPIYYMDLYRPLTKEEIEAELDDLEKYMEDDSLPSYMKDDLSFRIEELTGSYPHAKSNAELERYDGTLNKQYAGSSKSTNHFKCFMGKEKAADISFYQMVDEAGSQLTLFNGPYNTWEPYAGVDAERLDITYEEARALAEDFVRKMDGRNTDMIIHRASICYLLGTVENYTKETSPQAYAFNFARSYNGVVSKYVSPIFGWDDEKEVDISKAVDPEGITVVIDDDGITEAFWSDRSETVKTLAKDVPLLDFDTVSGLFEEYCGQFEWIPQFGQSNLPEDVGATLHVKRVEMNLMVLAENDDLTSCITVPVWDFIADMEYDREVLDEQGRPFVPQEDVCILTVNAIDGTAMDRVRGH